MLQNPQVASMLTPFHHAAAMQAAALHHAAASQNNPSGMAAPPTDSSVFNTSLSASNSVRDHHTGQQSGSSMPHLTPLTRMSPPGHPQKEISSHQHGSHMPPQSNPHHHPNSLPPMGPPPPAGSGHPHIPPGHFLPHPHHGHLHPHHPHLGLEPPKPRFMFKMPRVVPNQKEKYESDDLMKRHSREGEVRYTGYRDRPLHERQNKFLCAIRDGHAEVAFISTGFNVLLSFDPTPGFNPANRQADFEKEPGKVHIKSPFILNGVCVRWKGYLDMERLDGVGAIEFDEEAAAIEDAALRDTVEAYNRRVKEFEEHSKARSRQIAAFQHAAAAHAAQAAQAAHVAAHQQAVAAESASARPTSPSRVASSITTLSSSTASVSSSIPAPSEVSPTPASAVMASPTNNNLIGSSSVDSVTSLANSFLANSHSISSMGSLAAHTGSGLSSLNSETAVDQKSIADPAFGSPNTGINIHAEIFEARKKQLELSVAAAAAAASSSGIGSSAASITSSSMPLIENAGSSRHNHHNHTHQMTASSQQ